MISQHPPKQRTAQFTEWLANQLPHIQQILPLAADASFRRYFRLVLSDKTLIAVDAPPDLENSQAFVGVAKVFADAGLHVPLVIAYDLAQGFLLLGDFGDDLLFRVLNSKNVDQLYGTAINRLLTIQSCTQNNGWNFPPFDTAVFMGELNRFRQWYLETHRKMTLTASQQQLLTETFQALIQSALEQPQVCVHRDYHSRNLLALPKNEIGIIDFQDAVWGPITYDLVSLIRDCYVAWPQEKVTQWALHYFQLAANAKLLPGVSAAQFMRWFDWMGIQRHLKAMFIFARKWHRDGNDLYLQDIPRTLNYVLEVSQKYPELTQFRDFLLSCQ